MAHVTVTINSKTHKLACDDGQESHVVRLAADYDVLIEQLKQAFGEIGDTRLAVMAGIVVSDQLEEAKRKIAAFEAEIAGLNEAHNALLAEYDQFRTDTSEVLEALTIRLEHVSQSLHDTADETITAQAS
jgi:cell division protein ZapA